MKHVNLIDWAKNSATSVGQTVSRKVGEVKTSVSQTVDGAVAGAHDLYNRASSGLSEVKTQVADTAQHVVDKASDTAKDLYNKGKSGLSQVVKDDGPNALGNLKYANPMYYTGKVTEVAGKGVKWVGSEINEGANFLDKHSKDLPGFIKPQVGVVSGALGFAGGLVEGVGGLAEYTGKLTQGNQKTIDGTVDTVKHVGEGAAYIDGKVREGTGNLIAAAGSAVHSDTIQAVGQGYSNLGKAEQGLADDKTKQVLDGVGTGVVHYGAALGTAEWKAVGKVGEWTGSETLQSVSQKAVNNGEAIQQQTTNGLTQAVDKVVSNRVQEYKENGAYAVPRDITRVVAEIGTAVIAPEAILGKAGEAARLARGAEGVADLARGAEGAADLARGAEGVRAASKVGEAGSLAKPLKLQEMQTHYVGEHLPGNDIWSTSVKYLEGGEKEAHRLTVKDGKFYDAGGQLFDTTKAATAHSGDGRAIFVMDEQGKIYASLEQRVGEFHHSSLAGGKPVAAAGELEIVNGELKMISNRSGHYRPSQELIDQALDVMHDQGVAVNGVRREGF